MKEKIARNFLMILLFVSVSLIVYLLVMDYNDTTKKGECLEPYAVQICQERGLYYYDNNDYYVRCKSDLRSIDPERFLFNETEKESCG